MTLFWKKRKSINFSEKIDQDIDVSLEKLLVRCSKFASIYSDRIIEIEVKKEDDGYWVAKIHFV